MPKAMYYNLISMFRLLIWFIIMPCRESATLAKIKKKAGKEEPNQKINVEANVNVAIAMALHLYFDELHDEESNIITIHNAPKQYSPWSSKIYGVQNQPVKK